VENVVKIDIANILKELLDHKFLLIQSTDGKPLKDSYRGICKEVGNNHLGKLLMKIRDDFSPHR